MGRLAAAKAIGGNLVSPNVERGLPAVLLVAGLRVIAVLGKGVELVLPALAIAQVAE